jgi:hypothetical protein
VDLKLPAAQVGVPLLLTKQDLKRVAPLWLHYSRQVRLDPEVSAISIPHAHLFPALIIRLQHAPQNPAIPA